MLKLYMKQKVFSWKDRFTVWDEFEQDRYTVEGEFFTLGKKLHIYDAFGTEVAFIHQKVFSFLPRFFVYIGGVKIAEIVKELTFFHPKYRIEGLDWQIEDDFWAHQYTITKNGETIVSLSKEWLSWGDSYAIEITHLEDTLPALAVVLAIDCVMASEAVAASASS